MRFIAADRIFDGTSFLSTDSVLVYDDQNLLKDIVASASVEPSNIQRLPGMLTPGFVNAHCHLELSHLKGTIPQGTGLPAFGPLVVQNRNKHEGAIFEFIQEAERSMMAEGIVAVGDISNTDMTFATKSASRLCYHTFIELIGFNPVGAKTIFERGKILLASLTKEGLKGSLAAHAPYSCSRELIEFISSFDTENNLSFCIHNQESAEETAFFMGEQSGFYELYKKLNLDITWWKPPGHNSLSWYLNSLKAPRNLLVHNSVTTKNDVAAATGKGIYWCFCPSANLYIEGNLPDLSLFNEVAGDICVGTDSLASNDSLSIVKELNLLMSENQFDLPQLLRAATRNGAEALMLEDQFGGLIIGRNAGLVQLEFQNNKLIFKGRIL